VFDPKRFSVVFMGTPALSVPFLERLVHMGFSVKGVVTQPDRPAGRGQETMRSPVKVNAERIGIPVETPSSLRSEEANRPIFAWEPDVIVVVAYGKILPKVILDRPKWGCVNVHASLLPKLRGASPIQWAILNGFSETGLTLMRMDEGMDTGPIIAQTSIRLDARETTVSLSEKMARSGPDFLEKELPLYLSGQRAPVPQEGPPSLAPLIRKENGRIPFEKTSFEVDCHVRAMNPWPGAFCESPLGPLKILSGEAVSFEGGAAVLPGTIVRSDRDDLAIACGKGVYRIAQLQKPGGRILSAREFLAGNRLEPGARLGVPS
jgi:methionyl-tRNA formyltransferase